MVDFPDDAELEAKKQGYTPAERQLADPTLKEAQEAFERMLAAADRYVRTRPEREQFAQEVKQAIREGLSDEQSTQIDAFMEERGVSPREREAVLEDIKLMSKGEPAAHHLLIRLNERLDAWQAEVMEKLQPTAPREALDTLVREMLQDVGTREQQQELVQRMDDMGAPPFLQQLILNDITRKDRPTEMTAAYESGTSALIDEFEQAAATAKATYAAPRTGPLQQTPSQPIHEAAPEKSEASALEEHSDKKGIVATLVAFMLAVGAYIGLVDKEETPEQRGKDDSAEKAPAKASATAPHSLAAPSVSATPLYAKDDPEEPAATKPATAAKARPASTVSPHNTEPLSAIERERMQLHLRVSSEAKDGSRGYAEGVYEGMMAAVDTLREDATPQQIKELKAAIDNFNQAGLRAATEGRTLTEAEVDTLYGAMQENYKSAASPEGAMVKAGQPSDNPYVER